MTDSNAAELSMDAGPGAGAAVAMNLGEDGEVPPCLQTMPTDVLRHALVFVGNVPDLLSCERTCVALRLALSDVDGGDDAVWRSVLVNRKPEEVAKFSMCLSLPAEEHMTHGEFLDRADADPRLKTNREVACVLLVLERIECSGAEPNVFLHKLGVYRWMHLVTGAFSNLGFWTSAHNLPPGMLASPQYAVITPDETFDGRHLKCRLGLRGDSSVVLSELLQQEMVDLFERANFILTEEMEGVDDGYPCLLARHLRVAYLMARTGSGHLCLGLRTRDLPPNQTLTYAQCTKRLFCETYIERAERLLQPTALRDRMIRGLALGAGVVKIHPDAFRMAWSMLIHTTIALVEVPCRELFSLGRGVVDTKRPLESDQSMWDTPPYPKTVTVMTASSDPVNLTIYTPAPRQLEETSRSLGMRAQKVFIHDWHVPEGSSLGEEMAAASREYAEDEGEDVSMTDAGLHEVDGDYIEGRDDDDGSDDHYLSSDFSSCGYPSSDFDSDDDIDDDFHPEED